MINLRDWQVTAYDSIKDTSGIVVASTGSGKSFLGYKLIEDNPSHKILIVVPTIVLMNQWYDDIVKMNLSDNITRIGGGHREMPKRSGVTIAVINSLHGINLGHHIAKFDHIVFDEVHRYASSTSLTIIKDSVADHKIGMTATLERPDEREKYLKKYIGEVTYEMELGSEESNKYVAPFDIVTEEVFLTKEEKDDYIESHDRLMLYFPMFSYNITEIIKSTKRRDDWGHKARLTNKALQDRRKIIMSSAGKKIRTFNLVTNNPDKKIVIFDETQYNAEEIYKMLIDRGFKCSLYHSGRGKKNNREEIDKYKNNETDILVTVRALDEGMNVPNIDVAIIVNGNSQKRQFFQRLGRAIRKVPGKRAKLYMLFCSETYETNIIKKRLNYL